MHVVNSENDDSETVAQKIYIDTHTIFRRFTYKPFKNREQDKPGQYIEKTEKMKNEEKKTT